MGARRSWAAKLSVFRENSHSTSLRTADVFPVVASLPPKNNMLFFGGREATTGNTSSVRRLTLD